MVPFTLSNSSIISSDTSETEGGPLEALGPRSWNDWELRRWGCCWDFRLSKGDGLGKSNGRVKRVFGSALDTSKSSMDNPAVTSSVTAIAGASGAKLAVLLAKSGGKIAALPCPEKTVGVGGWLPCPDKTTGDRGGIPCPKRISGVDLGLPCPNGTEDSAPNGLEGRIGSLVGIVTEVSRFSVGG